MRVRLSLHQLKATPARKLDWKAFASECDLQACNNIMVKNNFQVADQEESTRDCYQHFTEANTEAMKLLPKVRHIKESRVSEHPEVQSSQKGVQESAGKLRNEATEEARDKLTAVKTRLFEVYDK